MKKIISIFSILILSICICACSSNKNNISDSNSEIITSEDISIEELSDNNMSIEKEGNDINIITNNENSDYTYSGNILDTIVIDIDNDLNVVHTRDFSRELATNINL